MSRKQPTFALSLLVLFGLTLVFLFLAQLHGKSAGAEMSAAAQEQSPFAMIKTVVVNGAERAEAAASEATVVHEGKSSGPKAGMMLYIRDEIKTGPTVKLTILFLDNAAENDNKVLVDANSHVQLGSLFTWAGRILANVKGTFETKTERGRWSVQGTEYELVVKDDGTNTLEVLKGTVQVLTGPFSPTGAAHSGETDQYTSAPMFVRAAFRPPEGLPQQNQMEFVAVSGRVTNIERDFIFTNSCQRPHVYKISAPLNLNWFQFLGADQFAIEGKGTRTIKFAIKLDGTNVPVGTQESQIVAACLDCSAEPGCGIGGLLRPITVKVIDNPTGSTPTPTRPPATPTPTEQPTPLLADSALATRMQQITLPPGGRLVKSAASVAQIDQTLNWSNGAIIPGEPTYSAQSVVPRYRTWEERNQVFREARRSSILNDDSLSKEILADVYIDWGNGAKAEQELKGLSQASPERLTTLGEAYRLMGDLKTAELLLNQATSLDPAWSPALNALGNVYLDQAKAAQDRKDYVPARGYLQRAKQAYTRALAARPAESPDGRNHRAQQRPAASVGKVETVAHSNLGEVHLRMGQIAHHEGSTTEAIKLYDVAEQEFGNSAKADPRYQFAFNGLGDVYRETGETLGALGDTAKANEYFVRSQGQYDRALKLHGDMAEAYVGLGKAFDDQGRHGEALDQYRKATQVRPDLAEPHYHFAVALAPFDPRGAAEQARAFLKIERPPLKQGEKAKTAVAVIERRPVPVQTVTPVPGSTVRPSPSPSFYPSPSPSPPPSPSPGKPVRVPGLKGDKTESALNELRKLGLKGELRDQPDCDASGKVLYTEPAKDVRVPEGTLVTVFVSSLDPNAVTVPRVSGLSRSDAEERLRQVGLRTKIGGTSETDDRERDTVLQQKPDQGRPLMQGCEVALTLAVPVPKVKVPNFVGLSRDEALRRLPRFSGDLTRGSITEVDSNRPVGTVVDQNPKPETWVRKGSAVHLFVARPQPVVVPNLVGKHEDQAKLIIGRMQGRLTFGQVTYHKTSQFPDHTVMSHDPVAGQTVPFGKVINFVVAVADLKE